MSRPFLCIGFAPPSVRCMRSVAGLKRHILASWIWVRNLQIRPSSHAVKQLTAPAMTATINWVRVYRKSNGLDIPEIVRKPNRKPTIRIEAGMSVDTLRMNSMFWETSGMA